MVALRELHQKQKKRVEKLVDDYKSLRQPEKFNEAYPILLKEINRRRVFNAAMTTETDMLNKAIDVET